MVLVFVAIPQIMADVLTIIEKKGRFEGLKVDASHVAEACSPVLHSAPAAIMS
jgi:hypothetical protein